MQLIVELLRHYQQVSKDKAVPEETLGFYLQFWTRSVYRKELNEHTD